MSQITKILKMAVGSYQGKDKPITEYREIGVEIEHQDSNGNTWTELKINADILNPVLFALVKPSLKGSSGVWVKKFDVTRRTKTNTPANDDDIGSEDDIPF